MQSKHICMYTGIPLHTHTSGIEIRAAEILISIIRRPKPIDHRSNQ